MAKLREFTWAVARASMPTRRGSSASKKASTLAAPQEGLRELLAIIAGGADMRLPAEAHASLIVLAAEL